MEFWIQTAIVAGIVLAALIYVIYKVCSMLTPKSGGCGCGSAGCGEKKATDAKIAEFRQMQDNTPKNSEV